MPYTLKQRKYFHYMAKSAKTAKERAEYARLANEADHTKVKPAVKKGKKK